MTPAIARSSIATTLSATRRPFGNPAASPPSSPKMFGLFVGVGAIEVFSRSMSASTGPVRLVNPVISPAGMPVSKIASRSARGFPDSPARPG